VRRLGAGLVALIGLWIILSSLAVVPALLGLSALDEIRVSYFFVVGVLPCVVAVAIGAWLIAKRQRLAEDWFPDEPLTGAIDALTLLRIGLILIGVWIATWGIVEIVRHLALVLVPESRDLAFEPRDVFRAELPGLIARFVQVMIGLALLVYSTQFGERLLAEQAPDAPEAKPDDSALPRCPECGTAYDPADYRGGLYPAECDGCGAALDVAGAEQARRADRPEA